MSDWILNRREFIKTSCAGFFVTHAMQTNAEPLVRFGVVTDCHYADEKPRGSRYYAESLYKLRECVDLMNEQKVDFIVELGDLKDQSREPDEQETISFLKEIESVYAQFNGPRYYVLGNHDVDSISKDQFWDNVNLPVNREGKSYYSFAHHNIHFVVLDSNFRSDDTDYDHGNFDWTDANVPDHELEWLKQDLSTQEKPAIVFGHQLLDGKGNVYINNAAEVRAVLDSSEKVIVVFNGHHHAGQYNVINGIHYVTQKAVVEGSGEENNAYTIVELYPDGTLIINGYRRAESRQLS